MKYEFINNQENILLPKEAIADKINIAGEIELKVLLYSSLVANEENFFDEQKISEISGIDISEVINALQFWRGAGVIFQSGKNNPAPNKAVSDDSQKNQSVNKALQRNDIPIYSGKEIEDIFEKHSELRLLIDECQRLAGKVFNPHEMNKIVSLYDYLGLSAEFILSVFNYCAKKNKTTVHYIEKTAFNLYNEGIDTDEKLEEYLKNKEIFDSNAGKIRKVFGIGQRALTKKEEEMIKKWTEVWKFDIEMIEYAYELTVNSTSTPSMPYAAKILENWYKAGYTTLDEAKEASFEFKKSKNNDNNHGFVEHTFDTDEFFEIALKRSYENIGKKPENN